MIKRGQQPKHVILTDYTNKDEFLGVFNSVVEVGELLNIEPDYVRQRIAAKKLINRKYEAVYLEDEMYRKSVRAFPRLREAIKEQDIKRSFMAEDLGISLATLCKAINQYNISRGVAREIAKYLDMNQAELFESVVIENN